ncbi:hypothetical protein NDU88_008583 [Pleurodeles waltl]|uniref:Uncharacterized protein n=1 Tax=Pleurodeles waltl TaxID=8319 RepID=A0AAV7PPJ2_PLEWA|nr:hypothetical protein NDU88_008583 [Pleurodeles waltl]
MRRSGDNDVWGPGPGGRSHDGLLPAQKIALGIGRECGKCSGLLHVQASSTMWSGKTGADIKGVGITRAGLAVVPERVLVALGAVGGHYWLRWWSGGWGEVLDAVTCAAEAGLRREAVGSECAMEEQYGLFTPSAHVHQGEEMAGPCAIRWMSMELYEEDRRRPRAASSARLVSRSRTAFGHHSTSDRRV